MKYDFMKKTLIIFLCLVFCVSLISCKGTDKNSNENSTQTSAGAENDLKESLKSVNENSVNSTSQNELKGNSFVSGDTGDGVLNPQKYRICFYQIPAFFSNLVDKNTYEEWCETFFVGKYPDDTNEMVMVSFIKEFNISREDFDKANVEYGKFVEEVYYDACMNPQDFAEQEFSEVYNADIIYTFDNNVISEYYLGNDYPFFFEDEYKAALENGTYETRTTDWIDVDQMEAEINAKYGTQETTAVTEKTAE